MKGCSYSRGRMGWKRARPGTAWPAGQILPYSNHQWWEEVRGDNFPGVSNVFTCLGSETLTSLCSGLYIQSESCSVVSDSCDPMVYTVHGILQARITGVCSLSLLQGIFPTQGWNPGLLHCRRILYQLSHKGSLPIQQPWKRQCLPREQRLALRQTGRKNRSSVPSSQSIRHDYCLL